MANILALSSWVAHGHVGLSAALPVLQALGHQVTALPTVMLSNHRGWPHCAGDPVPVETLQAMVDALVGNGWFAAHDVLLVGYLPSPAHVAFAETLAGQVPMLLDPVLGDDPKGLYVPDDVAAAIRETLVPLANTITPNRFELSFLTGTPVNSVSAAIDAALTLPPRITHVTSAPLQADETGLLSIDRTAKTLELRHAPRRDAVPNGTGDVLAALLAAGLSAGHAFGALTTLIEASLGASHLRIAETAPAWTAAPATPAKELPWPSTLS